MRILAALTLLIAAGIGQSALAADIVIKPSQAKWRTATEGKDAAKTGLVPLADPNGDYVGVTLHCQKGKAVTFSFFLDVGLRNGKAYPLTVMADSRTFSLQGKAQLSGMDDLMIWTAGQPVAIDSDMLAAMAAAKTLKIEVSGKAVHLPVANIGQEMGKFVTLCRGGR